MENKKTAVEWLMNNLIERNLIKTDDYIKSFLKESLEQAKEIEKQQKIKHFVSGAFEALRNRTPRKDCIKDGYFENKAEEYFNDIYLNQ